MRILAIDPGNEMSAYVATSGSHLDNADKMLNMEVLVMLRNSFLAVDFVAIEMIASYGMAVGREVFETCLWIGRFMEACNMTGRRVELVYRKDVKLHLCESARANDANIRAALIDRYGPGKEKAIGSKKAPGPLYGLKGDEWSALAVAITAKHLLDSTK